MGRVRKLTNNQEENVNRGRPTTVPPGGISHQ